MAELEWEKDLETAANLPLVGDIYKNYQWVIYTILAISRFMSFPVYVFLHRNIGERTYSVISVYFHLILLGVATFNISDIFNRTKDGGLNLNVIVWLFIGLIIYNAYKCRKRNKTGEHIHSRSIGEPYGFWSLLPWGERPSITIGIYEPLAIIGTAWLLTNFNLSSTGVTSYMTLCGIALFINMRLMLAVEHSAYLDDIDSQLDAEYKHQLQQGNLPTVKEAQGVKSFSLASASPEKKKRMLQHIKDRQSKQRERNIFEANQKPVSITTNENTEENAA